MEKKKKNNNSKGGHSGCQGKVSYKIKASCLVIHLNGSAGHFKAAGIGSRTEKGWCIFRWDQLTHSKMHPKQNHL